MHNARVHLQDHEGATHHLTHLEPLFALLLHKLVGSLKVVRLGHDRLGERPAYELRGIVYGQLVERHKQVAHLVAIVQVPRLVALRLFGRVDEAVADDVARLIGIELANERVDPRGKALFERIRLKFV